MAEEIPSGAFRFDLSATYNRDTIPRELSRLSTLPAEVWAQVIVEAGALDLSFGSVSTVQRLRPGQDGIVPPETPFKFSAAGGLLQFHVEYYHEPRLNDAELIAGELGKGRAGTS